MIVHPGVRTLTVNAVLVTATAWSLGGPACSCRRARRRFGACVRDNPLIAALIEHAITHSPTFKGLVATVEASNGIVYVQYCRCPGRIVACLPISMTSGGGNRFMHIVVNRERIESDGQLLGPVGHELQHATEVLSDRSVTNSTKMYFFYRRYAPTGKRAIRNAGRNRRGERR